ncbi:hypothetical protein [Escherichia coli]|uniref:hypothetical protein n=1 Tax=Escherichia coli TaxID=562 RepID=UPI003EBB3009
MLESTNLSVGRGTDTPFEIVGAPFIDGEALASNVSARGIPGVAVEAVTFTPKASPHQGKTCRVRRRCRWRGRGRGRRRPSNSNG